MRQITSRTEWESAVFSFAESNFLQSWGWGETQEKLGKTVIRLAWFNQAGDRVVALVQAILEPARRGAYLAVAGGPLLDWQDANLLNRVFSDLKQVVRQHHCVFIRFRPQYEAVQCSPSLKKTLGLVPAPMHLTADLTIELDLTLSEEELLKQMRKQHRQAIRKADQLGIVTEISTNPAAIEPFYQTQLELAKRHQFVPFSLQFLQTQFDTFAQYDQVALITTSLDGVPLASAFVIFYHREAVYHYGVSTEANLKLPGSYACQWSVIREAQRRGCARYNLWGVAAKDRPDHRYAGTGLFKRGFGGREVQYLPAHDVPLSQRYWLTWMFEQLRKKRRKL